MTMYTPILAQHLERVIGEGYVTILGSFAQVYVDHLAVAIDVTDLEINSFL